MLLLKELNFKVATNEIFLYVKNMNEVSKFHKINA